MNVTAVYPTGEPMLRADRRALFCGFHADVYVFVQLARDLRSASIIGAVLLEAFVERSWLDPSGAYLVVDPVELQDISRLESLLAEECLQPDVTSPMDHGEVFDRIATYEDGQIPAEERGPLERHLYGCAECRRELIALRYFRDAVVQEVQSKPGTIVEFGARTRKGSRRQPVRALLGRLAAADEGFELEVPKSAPIGLFIPGEGDAPRLTKSGIAGILILPDGSLAGATVTVELDLDFDGIEPEPFTVLIQGEIISLDHALDPDPVRRWLRESLAGGRSIVLSKDHLRLRS